MIEFKKKLVTVRHFHNEGKPHRKLTNTQIAHVERLNQKIEKGSITFETIECLCGCESFDIIASVDRYSILQQTVICRKCGLVQSNPRMTESDYRNFYESDEYRNIYENGSLKQYTQYKYEENPGRKIHEKIVNHKPLSEISDVFEIGAGGGWNLLTFFDHNISVLGLEYSPKLVSLGLERGINMIKGGIEALAEDSKYDIIILNHVLEHLLDPVEDLRTMKNHLAENGLFYLAIPNIMHFSMGQIQNAHCYYFNPWNFEYYTSKAGLKLIDFGDSTSNHMYGIFSNEKSNCSPDYLLKSRKQIYKKIRAFNNQYRIIFFLKRIGLYSTLRNIKQITVK